MLVCNVCFGINEKEFIRFAVYHPELSQLDRRSVTDRLCNCFGSFEALQVDDAYRWPCPRGCRWRRQSHTGQSHTGHQSFVRSRGAQSLGGRCRRDRGCVQHCGSPNPRSNSASSARMFATGAISMPGAILPSSKRICSSSSLLLPFPCDSIFSWRLVRIVLCWNTRCARI